jgi:hypothetical protein
MRYALLLADAGPESNKAGPLGLLTIVLLGVAVYFLYRSMVRHLKKVPTSFEEPTAADKPAESRAETPAEADRREPPTP